MTGRKCPPARWKRGKKGKIMENIRKSIPIAEPYSTTPPTTLIEEVEEIIEEAAKRKPREPQRRRGVVTTWRGAKQVDMNVYTAGSWDMSEGRATRPWFEHYRGYANSGQQTFRVHGMNKGLTAEWFEQLGIPVNKIYWGGVGKLFVKVPGGVLYEMGWPWESAIGYPSEIQVHYWVHEEGWSGKPIGEAFTSYDTWIGWYDYIDVRDMMDTEEEKAARLVVRQTFRAGKVKAKEMLAVMVRENFEATMFLESLYGWYEDHNWKETAAEGEDLRWIDTYWDEFFLACSDHSFSNIWWYVKGLTARRAA